MYPVVSTIYSAQYCTHCVLLITAMHMFKWRLSILMVAGKQNGSCPQRTSIHLPHGFVCHLHDHRSRIRNFIEWYASRTLALCLASVSACTLPRIWQWRRTIGKLSSTSYINFLTLYFPAPGIEPMLGNEVSKLFTMV